MANAIEVRDLVKDYRLYGSPGDLLTEIILRKPRHTPFRALNGISFDVAKGEVVGIIGRNGAGKSTLLKVLTGVVEHDGGTVHVDGKVAAILELGTGLNPDYSGRDNILFGAVCRGLPLKEAKARLDEIIAFAELGDVIDRPFKTYSSGMQARLLFSTSIHVDSDILIIDEALAAGDVLFQEKCFRRMREIARSGRSVLFVSHGLDLVQQLCHRAILMHAGEILLDGDTGTVTKAYLDLAAHIRNDAVLGRKTEKTAAEAREIVAANARRQDSAGSSSALDKIRRMTEEVASEAAYEAALQPAEGALPAAAAVLDRARPRSLDGPGAAISEISRPDAPAGATRRRLAGAAPEGDGSATSRSGEGGERASISAGKIEMRSVRVLDEQLRSVDTVEYGRSFFVSASFVSNADMRHLIAGFELRLPTGFMVFSIQNTLERIDFGCRADEPFEVRWKIDNRLQNGPYFLGVGIGEVLGTAEDLRHLPFTILAQELNALTFTSVSAREFAGPWDIRPSMQVVRHPA